MANVYVRSGAGGAGTGADWANAYTTLAAALSAKSAGDDFWVSEDHAESTAAAITLTSPGSLTTPCRIICVDHAGSVPPVEADLATTAEVATTGASAHISFGGVAYCYGIIFRAGDSTNTQNIGWTTSGNYWIHKNCLFHLRGSNNTSLFRPGAGSNVGTIWDNCQVTYSGTTQAIRVGAGRFEWKNTADAVSGATIGNLFDASCTGWAIVHGVGLSDYSSKTLVPATANGFEVLFENCALPGTVTNSGAHTSPTPRVHLTRSDDSGNVGQELYTYYGTETLDVSIVRTGGASDGTTQVSKKIVTTANSEIITPFESLPIAIWNDNSGSSKTLTVYGIWGGGAVPDNDDIWIEVEYLGDASTPNASFISSGLQNPLDSAAACSSDASSWNGSTTAFKMSVTFTPQQKGPVIVRVFAAAASSTFYIDPKIEIS